MFLQNLIDLDCRQDVRIYLLATFVKYFKGSFLPPFIGNIARAEKEEDGVKSVGDVLPITASIYRDFQILICALDSEREAWTFAR